MANCIEQDLGWLVSSKIGLDSSALLFFVKKIKPTPHTYTVLVYIKQIFELELAIKNLRKIPGDY